MRKTGMDEIRYLTLELRLLFLSSNNGGQAYLLNGRVVDKILAFSAIDKA